MIDLRFMATIAACLLPACSVNDDHTESVVVDASAINSTTGEVGPIAVGMSLSEIRATGVDYSLGSVFLEGDEYQTIEYVIEGAPVIALLNHDDSIDRLQVGSDALVDQYGLGVGVAFEQVASAYPMGRSIIEFADGKVANYVTGTHLIFEFDADQLAEECFYQEIACTLEGLVVTGLIVSVYQPR